MNVRARLWGALLGAVIGVSWLVWGWRFLWVVVFLALGYLVGRFLESREEILEKLRELGRVMFRP